MAIALVGSVTTQVSTGGSSSNAPSITRNSVSAGNCLVAVASIGDAADLDFTITNTTDGTNTYTTRTAVCTDANQRLYAVVAYALNVAAGNFTVAFNLAGTSAGANRYFNLGLYEFSGVATASAEDTWDANDDIDSSGAVDASAGPITTTDAGDLIIGCCAVNAADDVLNFVSPTSWTNAYRQNDSNGFYGMDSGYWLPGATQTTYTAQWSHDNSSGYESCAVVVALKPAGAGGGTTPKGPFSNPFAGPFGGPI